MITAVVRVEMMAVRATTVTMGVATLTVVQKAMVLVRALEMH